VTEQPFGPFCVDPGQISELGVDFADFVNELLRIEAAAAGLDGGQLTTTRLVNVGDGGVDAGFHRSVATTHIPKGDSAWQFKSGDLEPAKCRAELRGGSEALDVLRGGGSYRLVLGKDLTAAKVRRRRKALEVEAEALGIEVRTGMFEVLNASDLAAWAGEHPALAVSPLLRGIGNVAQPFWAWSAQYEATGTWVDTLSRSAMIDEIRKFVVGSDPHDLHVHGVSGVGKTRTVLEAIRGQDFESLVAYLYAADVLPPTLIHHLQTQARHTILVVDECDAKSHEILARQLRTASAVKLITIGEVTGYRGLATTVTVGPLEEDAVRQAAHNSQPGLQPEHARFVVDASAGNMRLAQLLAQQIVQQPDITVNKLIDRNIISTYVSHALPTGKDFLACCALALLPSFGYDDEPSAELTVLADAVELTTGDLRAAARTLADAGLLSQQGRYRSVAPHPLAIYLATRAWEDFHGTIVTTLIPRVDESVAERLFRRAADCGEHPVTKRAAERLLAPGGPYEHIDVWNTGGEGTLLQHLAALAPAAVLRRIETALAAMPDHDLRERSRTRHSVRWALERLAWRTATFHRAADALLCIAAVTPDLGSTRDATARSWTDLFGTMLPTTATPPAERMEYLREVAASTDRGHRLLAVTAAGQVLTPYEQTLVSAEVQGGVLVEHRGTPATWEDVFTYREAAIDLLGALARDTDPEVAGLAVAKLVGAIHPLLAEQRLRDHLAGVIENLPESGLSAARTKITHLTGLFERVDDDTSARALEVFLARLPTPTPAQTLEFLADAQPWDLADGELQQRLSEAAEALPVEERVSQLLSVLERRPVAAQEIGRTLAGLVPNDDGVQRRLVVLAVTNTAALVGYLSARVEDGSGDAFDQLLDSEMSGALDDLDCLRVSVFGPKTDAVWARVSALIPRLSPADGARGMLGWLIDIDIHQLRDLLAGWVPRIQSHDDYNAVIEFVSLSVHGRPPWIDPVDPLIADLVALRSQFGQLATMGEWEWRQLARRQLAVRPVELLVTFLDVTEAGGYNAFIEPEGPELLKEAVTAAGPAGWQEMMTRVHTGSWQVRTVAGPWLGNAADVNTVCDWVNGNIERARAVAAVTAPGGEQLHPVARFLITDFGADEQVSRSLRNALISRWGWGSEAARYTQLIRQVEAWGTTESEPDMVKAWIRATVEWLQTAHHAVLEHEVEPDQ